MASGSGKKTVGKGIKRNKSKVQEEDNWFEEDNEDDEGMETESEYAIPLPKKKTKQSPIITNRSPKEGGRYL